MLTQFVPPPPHSTVVTTVNSPSSPMTQALQSALVLDHGVPVGQIHFDRFF